MRLCIFAITFILVHVLFGMPFIHLFSFLMTFLSCKFIAGTCRFFLDNLIYFFDQMPQVLFLVWLLFEGGIYFIGKLADSNDS